MSVASFPSSTLEPKAMLMNIARDHGDEIEKVAVIIQTKEGKSILHSSSDQPGFLSVASLILLDKANRSIFGEVE